MRALSRQQLECNGVDVYGTLLVYINWGDYRSKERLVVLADPWAKDSDIIRRILDQKTAITRWEADTGTIRSGGRHKGHLLAYWVTGDVRDDKPTSSDIFAPDAFDFPIVREIKLADGRIRR